MGGLDSLVKLVRMPNDLAPAPGPLLEATAVAARLRMAMMRMVRRLKRQTAGEHSVSAISALASLKRLGAITLGELAEAEGVSRPSMTVLVRTLLAEGMVSKETDPSDGRLVRVRLTASANRVLEASRTRRTAYLAQRLRRLEAGELATLEKAATILERLLEEGP